MVSKHASALRDRVAAGRPSTSHSPRIDRNVWQAIRWLSILSSIAVFASACSSPQRRQSPQSGGAKSPANDPVPQPTGPQPTITGVWPNVVSTAGAWGTITGIQFQAGATVRIGDAAVSSVFRDSATIGFANSGRPRGRCRGCHRHQSWRTERDVPARLYVRGRGFIRREW